MPEKSGNDVRNWLVQLKTTSRLTNLSMKGVMNRLNSKKKSNLSRTCMLLRLCWDVFMFTVW